MKFIKNLKIRNKLFVSFGILLILTTILSSFSIQSLKKVATNYQYLLDMPIYRADLMKQVDTQYMTMRYRAANFVMNAQDPDFINTTLYPQYTNAYNHITGAIDKYKVSLNSDSRLFPESLKERQKAIDSLEKAFGELKEALDKTYQYCVAGDGLSGNEAMLAAIPTANIVAEELAALIEASNQLVTDIDQQSNDAASKAFYMILILAISLVIISIILAFVIANIISKPIAGLLNTVEEISKGHLNVNKAPTNNDEIGVLSDKFFSIVELIRDLIDEMSTMANEHHLGNTSLFLDIEKYNGDFGDMAVLTNRMVKEHIDEKAAAMNCVSRIVDGDFNADIEKLPGDKVIINDTINNLRKSLKNIIGEVDQLIEDCVNGNLTNLIDTKVYKGDWVELMEGLNNVMRTVAEPINTALGVLNDLSEGNFNTVMLGNYKGSFEDMQVALNNMVGFISSYINEISDTLNTISNGDLTVKINHEFIGDFATIKESIDSIVSKLNQTVSEIFSAADQILAGATQISSSSMTLADGASTQSAAVEELLASVDLISNQTKDNAQNAHNANELSDRSTENANIGNDEMNKMLVAMEGIKNSSNDISKIIRVIEDIAFQTNLLALNAAVEAARAGEHGKGFAVVADEVRNLAARSQNAARETTDLIEDSINRVNEGTVIAESTANSLKLIVENANEVSEIISQISKSSIDQATAVSEVNIGLSQISEVTVTNSSTSEETAAASEQLNSQAEVLRQMVSFFKI